MIRQRRDGKCGQRHRTLGTSRDTAARRGKREPAQTCRRHVAATIRPAVDQLLEKCVVRLLVRLSLDLQPLWTFKNLCRQQDLEKSWF